MVKNLSKISKSKVCVLTAGIAGPKGGSRRKPVGLVLLDKGREKIVVNKCYFKNKEEFLFENKL